MSFDSVDDKDRRDRIFAFMQSIAHFYNEARDQGKPQPLPDNDPSPVLMYQQHYHQGLADGIELLIASFPDRTIDAIVESLKPIDPSTW